MNEGGLYGERQGTDNILLAIFSSDGVIGWHLPAFSDENWADGNPTIGISEAGISFFRYVTARVVDAVPYESPEPRLILMCHLVSTIRWLS